MFVSSVLLWLLKDCPLASLSTCLLKIYFLAFSFELFIHSSLVATLSQVKGVMTQEAILETLAARMDPLQGNGLPIHLHAYIWGDPEARRLLTII